MFKHGITLFEVSGKDFDDLISTLTYKDGFMVTEMERGKEIMGDYVHHCLKCDGLSFEIEENLYRCSECGFEWEVICFE